MWATYSPSTCGMHTCLSPGLEAIFGQAPPNRLVRQALVFGELDHRTRQQLEVQRARPFGGLAQAVATSKASSLPVSLCSAPGTRLFAQRPLPIAFHEASLGPVHGRAAHADALCDLLVAGPGIGGQKNCARLSFRDACLPPLSSDLSSARSIWLSSRNFFKASEMSFAAVRHRGNVRQDRTSAQVAAA
jgi:hypothetical protein